MRAKDIMTTPVVTAGPETPVVEIAKRLLERRISAVPVIDTEGRVLGVVSRANLLQGIVARQRAPQATADDRFIRQQAIEAIRNSGVRSQFMDVQVAADIVSWGATDSDVERKAIVLAAEAVPGVTRFDSHMGVFPPMVRSGMWAE